MIQATVYLDGLAYQGVDEEGERRAHPVGAWYSHSDTRDRLMFGEGTPKTIEAYSTLRELLTNILERLREETLIAQEITIKVNRS